MTILTSSAIDLYKQKDKKVCGCYLFLLFGGFMMCINLDCFIDFLVVYGSMSFQVSFLRVLTNSTDNMNLPHIDNPNVIGGVAAAGLINQSK